MYDPKFRFALLVSMIVFITTVVQIIYTYILGEHGLNPVEYARGVLRVGAGILGGFFFVWAGVKFITFTQYRKTGFEAGYTDETGTTFNFPVSLSKFLPDVIAPPPPSESLHPLESEILGFLNSYRHWPYDISGHNKQTLYEHALEQWNAMKHIPDTIYLHRIAALSQDLGKVYAYNEKRKSFPYWMFWKKDSISHTRRCHEHGGLSAFVLAQFPSFRKLGQGVQSNQRQRRALLTAVRFANDPTHMPANCDPLARELYESLHKASQKAEELRGKNIQDFAPTPEEEAQINSEIEDYFQSIIKDLQVDPADINDNSDGVYLGGGYIVAHLPKVIKHYINVLSPPIRGAFNLWEIDDREHPSWEYFIEKLKGMGVLIETWEEVEATNGRFNLQIDGQPFPSAILLFIDKANYPDLRRKLDTLPKWQGLVEVPQNEESLIEEIKERSKRVDLMMAEVI